MTRQEEIFNAIKKNKDYEKDIINTRFHLNYGM